MQLRNCFNEGLLWFWCVSLFCYLWRLFWLFVALVKILGLCMLLCCLWSFGCLCSACRAWSGYESAGPLGAWVGTKVLDPLRAGVKVANYCHPSFVGTPSCVKTLVMMLRPFCHRIRTIRNSRSFLFVVRMIRSSLHCIETPNPRSSIIKFKKS
jgi:hypothetical protein